MRHVRVLDALGQCVSFRGSAYAAEVLADSPVAYWQFQECSGWPKAALTNPSLRTPVVMPIDSSGNNYNMTGVTGSPNYYYPARGPLIDSRDKGIINAGGSSWTRPIVTTVINNFTLEMWIYADILATSNQTFLTNGDPASATGWGMYAIFTGGAFRWGGWASGVAVGSYATTGLAMNTYYYLVCKRESGTWKYYLNGSPNGTGGTFTPNTPTGSVWVGGNVAFQRLQSHIAIYNYALSDARIAAHYAAR